MYHKQIVSATQIASNTNKINNKNKDGENVRFCDTFFCDIFRDIFRAILCDTAKSSFFCDFCKNQMKVLFAVGVCF